MELLYNHQFEVDKAVILAKTDKTSSYSRSMKLHEKRFILVAKKVLVLRQLGFLTYRSSKSYDQRFSPDEVVSYQRHQGNKFKETYDLSCYLTMLNVLDSHNVDRGRCR